MKVTVAVTILGLLATAAVGAAAPTRPNDRIVQASLVSESSVVAPSDSFWVAIRLSIADGWHLNWLNPGDAGLAPTVAWELPDGVTVTDIEWPYPRRFTVPELAIFGYKNEVLLPVQVTLPLNCAK